MKNIYLGAFIFISACATSKQTVTTIPYSATIIDGKLFTSVFQQKAAEYKALCYQAFNLARNRLDQSMKTTTKPKAVITDIDETVLNNSPYTVRQGLQGKDYEALTWFEWTSLSAADTVPGSSSFLKYAALAGVEIYYITNREERERAGTLKNLKKFNLPNADDAHLLMKQTISSKESRRQEIMAKYDVVLLLGDNLADFSSLFDKKTTDERNQNSTLLASEFGNRFIVLPNPVYGDWETSLYKYNYNLTAPQKDSIIRGVLKGY